MSDQNPPAYPDPTPPPAYGSQPYPGQPAGHQPVGYPAPGVPVVPYASWWSRVGATLLDGVLTFVLLLVPAILGIILIVSGTSENALGNADGLNAIGVVGILVLVFGYLAVIGFAIWNQAVRVGNTGQSFGKQWLGIQVVDINTGQFIGAGRGFLRWLVGAILGNLCFINYLWPLWDENKQTWHDKIATTVVIRK